MAATRLISLHVKNTYYCPVGMIGLYFFESFQGLAAYDVARSFFIIFEHFKPGL